MIDSFRRRGWILLQVLSVVNLTVAIHRRTPFSRYPFAFAIPSTHKMMEDSSNNKVVVTGQPPYRIASEDLSTKWIDLVRNEKVTATVQISDQDGSNVSVRYGVRLIEKVGGSMVSEEFVMEADLEPGQPNQSKLVQSINETLTTFQTSTSGGGAVTVKFVRNGNFAAQLQLVRTLRPAPSAGFDGATSAVPPPYDPTIDSFVTGPLRLELRPKVASLFCDGMTTSWDVFHNISPADTRGHFLLLPTLVDKTKNWRGQSFTNDDCIDLVYLTNSIEPPGSLFLGYNSVGGAASQNHIHCHAWPSPPIPLRDLPPSGVDHDDDEDHEEEEDGDYDDEDDEVKEGLADGWDCYAVSRLKSMYDFYDIDVGGGQVEVSYLKYPVFCVQLSASDQNLSLLGTALAATMKAIGDAPHNIGFLNRLQVVEDMDEMEKFIDVFVFARSKERSSHLPSLKLGISEMMGVFHAQSDEELNILGGTIKTENNEMGLMSAALRDISYTDDETLWNTIKDCLKAIDA